MLHMLLAAAIFAGPTKPLTTQDRLASYIVSVHVGAAQYADLLAERILWESQVHGLDPALFAAICYVESRYHLYQPGHDPRYHLASLWQIYPDSRWLKISRIRRMILSRDVVLSTFRAAALVAYWASRCGHTASCYAHYQSGYAKVSRGYVVALYSAAKTIRRHIHHGAQPTTSPSAH